MLGHHDDDYLGDDSAMCDDSCVKVEAAAKAVHAPVMDPDGQRMDPRWASTLPYFSEHCFPLALLPATVALPLALGRLRLS